MTDLLRTLALLTPLAPAVAALIALALRPIAALDRLLVWGAAACAVPGAIVGVLAIAWEGDAPAGGWYVIDGVAGVFTLVITGVAAGSAALSPTWLAHAGRGGTGALAARRRYAATLFAFWAVMAALPFTANLGLAWLLLELTTAASALLVAWSGGRAALEAGWKYLVLTTAGLAVALFGIVLLVAAGVAGEGGLHALDLHSLGTRGVTDPGLAKAGMVLLILGMAAKAGWAPVHNWLPDAHSEAPPPVSAMLSAALLPTVALVVWRASDALGPAVGEDLSRNLLALLGLASLAVAVPFLWRPLAWKRFLAYSSLEHMGVIAVGIGMNTTLAAAGVIAHVAGHALAKSLGFWSATAMLRRQPSAGRRPPRGLARLDGTLATAVVVSAGALSGLPPSPLFVSELLVVWGVFAAGSTAVGVLAALLLAMGFLGIIHVLIGALPGRPPADRGPAGRRATSQLAVASVLVLAGMVVVAAAALYLPGTSMVAAIAGIG